MRYRQYCCGIASIYSSADLSLQTTKSLSGSVDFRCLRTVFVGTRKKQLHMANESAQSVHLTKEFGASKEKLFSAWTRPEELKRWWRPLQKRLTDVQNDIRPGGTVAYTFEGGELQISGTYKEAIPNERLVYTWNWELPEDAAHKGEYLLTILFKGNGDRSTLEVRQDNFQQEHSIQPHQQGWEEALNDLHGYLSGGK